MRLNESLPGEATTTSNNSKKNSNRYRELAQHRLKIEQFSRKLSEFDAKLNGFKNRSGHVNHLNQLALLGPGSTGHNQQTSPDGLPVAVSPDTLHGHTSSPHVVVDASKSTVDQANCDNKLNNNNNTNGIHNGAGGCKLLGGRSSQASSPTPSSSSSTKKLSSSLPSIDCKIGSSKSDPLEAVVERVKRRMRTSSQLVSIRRQSDEKYSLFGLPSSNSSLSTPSSLTSSSTPTTPIEKDINNRRTGSRFIKSNCRSPATASTTSLRSTSSLSSAQSYSRLNSVGNNEPPKQTTTLSSPSKQANKATSIPNGLNRRLGEIHGVVGHHNSASSLDSGNCTNDGESESCSRPVVGSLLDSPKWSSIKEKFERSCQEEDKDKVEIKYSSPQPRRKSYPTSPLTLSSSLSNLTLLSPNRTRSISLSSSSMESRSPPSPSSSLSPCPPHPSTTGPNLTANSNNLSSFKHCPPNDRHLSTAQESRNNSKMTGKTQAISTNRLRAYSYSSSTSSSSSSTHTSFNKSEQNIETHSDYLSVDRNSNKSELETNQANRMKVNSRVAEIASKFDEAGVGSIGISDMKRIKSDLRDVKTTITVRKSSSECNSILRESKDSSSTETTTTTTTTTSNLSEMVSTEKVSVKETILRLECKSSSENLSHPHAARINRSISTEQHSRKPMINPRRKTLPEASSLQDEGSSSIQSRANGCANARQDDGTTTSSPNNINSTKNDWIPVPAPRKISTHVNATFSSRDVLKGRATSLSASSSPRDLNKDSTNEIDGKIGSSETNHHHHHHQQQPEPGLTNGKSSVHSSEIMMRKTPSFLWSNQPTRTIANNNELRENLARKDETSLTATTTSQSNENGGENKEPIYEPISYSPLPLKGSTNSPNNSNRDLRQLIIEDDNLSLNSETSSFYSDSSSYSSTGLSSGHHESSPSVFSLRSTPRSSSGPAPPPLPPRVHLRNASDHHLRSDDYSASLPASRLLRNVKSLSASNYEEILKYIQNLDKEDTYDFNHIYDTIHNLETDSKTASTPLDKSELLIKLLQELEAMSPSDEKKQQARDETGISRTPSTLSFSSISRNGSNASDGQGRNSAGSSTPRSSENSSPRGSLRGNKHTSTSQTVPPRVAPRTTVKSLKNSDGYANFPSIMENQVLSPSDSLMESILNASSPSLRETIQEEMRREENFHHLIRHESSSSSTNSSFLHPSPRPVSVVSEKSYVEAIDPTAQRRPNINDLFKEFNIHPESQFETVEVEGYIEFKETQGFLANDQPLYQFYDDEVKRTQVLWAHADATLQEDTEPVDAIYAELDDSTKCLCTICEGTDGPSQSQPHISAIDLVGKASALPGKGRLWCEVPQVKEGGIPNTLTIKERRHQEAMFEVITSEASYLKSLDILVNHFMKSEEFSNPEILDIHDKNDLFSNVEQVLDIAHRLMKDLDNRWQQNVIISDVCDILHRYATQEFGDYIKYLRFLKKQERTLKKLMKQPKFATALKRLESDAKCHQLSLDSFLLLPMQRITRYPLLVDAILNHRPPEEREKYEICQKALASLHKVVSDCNAAAEQSQRVQELVELNNILSFTKVKNYPLVSSSRYLLKKCEVTKFKPQSASLLYGPRAKNPMWKKSSRHLFLFNDLLLIAKKKSENNYTVNDYCERSLLQVRCLDNSGEETALPAGIKPNQENLIQLTFIQNHAKRTSEYFISFASETEKIRFVEAIEPPKSDHPNETIYEEWDCPQVICEKQYTAAQPDELNLEVSDVINVFRKNNDWYEGERIRDGARGWFPASFTQEIVNKHVRSRNLKLRHRLMILTESHILEMQKN